MAQQPGKTVQALLELAVADRRGRQPETVIQGDIAPARRTPGLDLLRSLKERRPNRQIPGPQIKRGHRFPLGQRLQALQHGAVMEQFRLHGVRIEHGRFAVGDMQDLQPESFGLRLGGHRAKRQDSDGHGQHTPIAETSIVRRQRHTELHIVDFWKEMAAGSRPGKLPKPHESRSERKAGLATARSAETRFGMLREYATFPPVTPCSFWRTDLEQANQKGMAIRSAKERRNRPGKANRKKAPGDSSNETSPCPGSADRRSPPRTGKPGAASTAAGQARRVTGFRPIAPLEAKAEAV